MLNIKITTIEELQNMHWAKFETFCAELMTEAGYKNARTSSKGVKGGDDGIDLLAELDGEPILGQCKCWKKNHTLINPIRELGGSLKKRSLEHGVFFVSIIANKYERTEAEAYGIKLWDADDLIKAATGYHEMMKNRPPLLKVWHGFLWLMKGLLKELLIFIAEVLAPEPKRKFRRKY